jgi:NADPH-dependent curcumin reductase CurA
MSAPQVEGVNTNRGIVVCRLDYADRFPEALADLGKWIAEGRIIRKYHILQGLEKAPDALALLFTGENTGKLFVPLTPNPCSDPFLTALKSCPCIRS